MVSQVLENKDGIVARIAETGVSQKEIEAKIRERQEEYGGLLTEAGAAYAIAKDMGIEFEGMEPKHEPIKVKDVKDGLEGIDIEGKVTQVFPVKRWEKESRKGRNEGLGHVREIPDFPTQRFLFPVLRPVSARPRDRGDWCRRRPGARSYRPGLLPGG